MAKRKRRIKPDVCDACGTPLRGTIVEFFTCHCVLCEKCADGHPPDCAFKREATDG